MLDRRLIFENGREFSGAGFGAESERCMEVVFNTSMVGYQEIISDPSYCDQLVTMTYPLIGNYGLTDEDYETRVPRIGGLIVREYNDLPSNYRYTRTLSDVMAENGIPGISGVDTRAITRMLRDEGSMRAIIGFSPDRSLFETPAPRDQVRRVSSKSVWFSRTPNYKYNVVAIDCGIKLNIVRRLNQKGCNVIVAPYDAPAATVLGMKPDAIFISNGPGDPEDAVEVIKLVRELQGRLPIFGICLGHQIIALANNARTYKMKFGHRGGNHPVMNFDTGKVEITSQNHSYAVDEKTVPGTGLIVTHKNLLDGTVEGLKCPERRLISVQYHPESAPGPRDSDYLFDEFICMMEEARGNA